MLAQLTVKPAKHQKFVKHNVPKDRSCGVHTKLCKRCGTYHGHISKYGLNLCRRCFREVAIKMGFKKFS